eukprot:15470922-Alexandrium_andersonii.AAC.1
MLDTSKPASTQPHEVSLFAVLGCAGLAPSSASGARAQAALRGDRESEPSRAALGVGLMPLRWAGVALGLGLSGAAPLPLSLIHI